MVFPPGGPAPRPDIPTPGDRPDAPPQMGGFPGGSLKDRHAPPPMGGPPGTPPPRPAAGPADAKTLLAACAIKLTPLAQQDPEIQQLLVQIKNFMVGGGGAPAPAAPPAPPPAGGPPPGAGGPPPGM